MKKLRCLPPAWIFTIFFALPLCFPLQAQGDYTFYIIMENGQRIDNIKVNRKPSQTNWKQVSFYSKSDPEKETKKLTPDEVQSFSTIVYRYFSLPCQLESGEKMRCFVAEQREGLTLLYRTLDEKGHLHLFIRPKADQALEELPAWGIREYLADKLPDFDQFVRDYKIKALSYDADELEEVLIEYSQYLDPRFQLKAREKPGNSHAAKGSGFHLGPEFSAGFRQMHFTEPSIEFEDIGYPTLVFTGGMVIDIAYDNHSSLLIIPRYTFYGIKQYPDSVLVRRNTFTLPFVYRYTYFTGKRLSPFVQGGGHAGIHAGAEFVRTYNGITKGFPMDPLYGGFQIGLGLEIQQKYSGDIHCSLTYSQSYGDKIQTRAFPLRKEKVQFSSWSLSLSWLLF